jgi:predicted XRE-type DNA-binding protein
MRMTVTKERPIIFSGPMVLAILQGRKTRRKLYVHKGEDPLSPEHIAARLANGLDTAPDGGCWEWRRTHNGFGYGTLRVGGKIVYAHRLAFELGNGQPIPKGMHVCHRCDNPRCINPVHLFLGTRSDNMADCFAKGRSSVKAFPHLGESNPASKLTIEMVEQIRKRLADGESQQSVADAIGISQSQVSNIKRGRQWK